jgi:autoinducer 2-degrading protein
MLLNLKSLLWQVFTRFSTEVDINSKIDNSGIENCFWEFNMLFELKSYSFNFTKNNTVMIVTCVYIHVKPESIKTFIEATTLNHHETLKEAGNLRFDLIQQADDPSHFMLYEAFMSIAAVENHKTTSHYLKWRETVEDLMAEPRHGVRYNIIEPGDSSKW